MTDLNAALPLPVRSDAILSRLATRRSASAQLLSAPGPSEAEIEQILHLGARTPDHGKLFPWRFVVLGPQSRADLSEALAALAETQNRVDKDLAVLAKLANPPLTIMVVSTPIQGHKVPVWEQQLSAGAVCMNIEHAADALGYSASWITDWYSYDPAAVALFGVKDGETIAGFIHLGTVTEAPLERPRPNMAHKVERRP
ncbi:MULTISPECIES: nitroreductase [unclassified Brevundimonas]|uniref:nitroreductase family protein n=1 Tax=unclassified Brevundimonas TaxID=2622653 RepID=UPI000CFC4FCF|nr:MULTISPECIES: nitroreductase [unclassified Brevundimonas]PRA27143.1 nitroreductase [Brevundimonas sp. MYb27]PQZ77395.1 nitroreductase [Brevundimonas sp. MYb31]PRB17560.1 nitroreductase [Brevundimonas sp. MYb52]PRB37932.1 nitroreductase [Brevundimonas sp. MYb46]PRB46280.1 nitroreductase [Brevundimonas sp. MYb33]